MPFKIFAAVLKQANDDVKARIRENYPEAFEYSPTFFLFKVPDTALSRGVAESVGLRGDDRIEGASGFVIQQRGAYAGYTRRDLWEWFSTMEGLGDAE